MQHILTHAPSSVTTMGATLHYTSSSLGMRILLLLAYAIKTHSWSARQ